MYKAAASPARERTVSYTHLLTLPIRHRLIICEPLLEEVDLSPYLGPTVEDVVAGGESGPEARICDYAWILALRDQCVRAGVPFRFKQRCV